MRKLWYTLSITSAAFLAGVGAASSATSMVVSNTLLYGAFAWFITSSAVYLWVTRRRS